MDLLQKAESIAKRIRAQVEKDSKPPTGNQNCQLCTWCAEANFRGIMTLPRPVYSPRDPVLEIPGEEIVKNPKRISIKNTNDVIRTIKSSGNGSRYYVHVKWRNGNGGHEFLLLNINNDVYVMDPQQGLIQVVDKTDYFDSTDFSKSFIVRLDDKIFNRELFDKNNDRSQILEWNESKDIPYMRDHDMLGDEEKQHAKDHGMITETFNPTKYTMRPAKESDLDFVYFSELETVGENKNDPKVQRYIKKDAKESLGHTKIIVVDNNDVGVYQAYATNEWGLREGKRDWWYLAHIYIKPEYRSHGIGTAIIKDDISKHDKILLQVMKSNPRARKLYESLGFVVSQENDHGGLVMRLDKSKTVQEGFVQEDIDIGALASTGLAAWKGSKQLKAESMDISMFKRLPMTRENLEKYSSGHGTFIQDLENYHLTQSDDGVILVDEHDIVAGLIIVRRTFDDKVWITRLARSLEWKNDGIILQLAKLAVDEFDAEFAAIDQNNTYVSKLLLNHGWKLLEQDSGMCLMKYVGGEEDEASEYTATDEDKNKFDEIMSEYMLEWGSSGKLFYHLSDQRSLDGQVFKPRVPAYIEPYNPHETAFENSTTPRVCFSSTIEGALNAITVNVQRTNPVTFRDMYVYIPEKPINEYKHKTNKELIRDHDVYDANVTKEMWILEPVRLKLYGVIHVDQARSVKRKSTVKTVDGKRDTRNYFTYKWHWLVKPKVLDSNPFNYDTMTVCRRLADEVNHFKYGLVKNGKLDTNPKEADWDKYWRLQSPEQFEQSGGGNCWDFVEWEAGYLDTYGIPCKKYYMSTINQDGKLETHTFIVVPNDGKYIYIEAAFKRVADEIHNIKEFDSLQAIFKYIAECMFEHSNCSVMNYGVFDYTDNTPKPGTDSKQYMDWITRKCKVVYDGSIDRKTKKRSESK